MKLVLTGFLLLFSTLLLTSCESYDSQQSKLNDTPTRGTIHVSADESFKPIIDQQVQVYEARNPNTHIIVDYKPEADCFRDLKVDSVKMVIATRRASEREEEWATDSLKLALNSVVVARDAIAVIMNPESPDSFFTMKEIVEVLKGDFNKNLIPVFDGLKATSTVRFLIDSVLKGGSITPKAMAARTSEEVIDYIAKNKGAIGFIGVSWVGNKEDSAQLGFLKKVKLVNIESAVQPGKYVLPYQVNIYDGNYPMVRDLVYMLKDRNNGLAKGFAQFMGGEIGQLIFRRAYLMPALRDFMMRKAELREESL